MEYTIVLEIAEEGEYIARCLELPPAISEGDSREEALENIREAIELVLEVNKRQSDCQ
ncbi:MAG: type II toxin-antitoxin system HicB family antitoxin [Methanolobus sp.]|nr:type II toxin-antitoxin system HicB family antitoxin [Methanolobus sp.]